MDYRSFAKIAAGLGGAAAAGIGLLWARERLSERPDYRVIASDGPFEVRRYPALLVAETVQHGARERAVRNGFGILADYIFAESRGGEEIAMTAPVLAEPASSQGRIAMTAPVLAEQDDDDGGWRVRFIMPAEYTRATLPAPGPGVAIAELPPRKMAVLSFGGRVDDALIERQEAALLEHIVEAGLSPAGGIEHAFYNSPFVPGPLRRNEILMRVD